MPWSAGIYSRGYASWTNDASANLPISATKFDTEDNDFASGLNNCLTKDGLNIPTSPMTWGLAAGQILAFTRGNDGTVISVGRTGGANNPVLQLQVADASGATLNLATAQTLALAISGTNAISVASTRAVTIGAPSSGDTLTLTGLGAGSFAIRAQATSDGLMGLIGRSGGTNNPSIRFSVTEASTFGQIDFSGNAGSPNGALAVNGTQAIVLSNNRNVTINAPAAGNTLALAGAAILLAARGQTTSGDVAQLGLSGGTNNPYLRVVTSESGNSIQLDASASVGSPVLNLSANGSLGLQVDLNGEVGIVPPPTIGALQGTFTQVGYMDTPQVNITANASLALTHRGKSIYITGTTAGQTLTIPANGSIAFPTTTTIIVLNRSNQNWLVAITTDTLTWLPSLATGTRTLAAGGVMTLYKEGSTAWTAWGFSIS